MKPIRNGVKGIIIENGRLLTIKLEDERGFWYALPGGGQEPGETLHEALRRECREEIGSEVIIRDLRFVRDYIGANHEFAFSDSEAHQVELMFLCDLREGTDPRSGDVPDEGQLGIEWLDLDRLDSYRLYPLGLRALIPRHDDPSVPVYVRDIS